MTTFFRLCVACFGVAGFSVAAEPVEVSLDEAGARVRAFGKGGIPDTQGHLHRPFLPTAGIKASLLFFVLHDCPKANALAPEMARLAVLVAAPSQEQAQAR